MPAEREPLVDGWEVARSAPDACAVPADTMDLDWSPARVPGTAAGALGDAGRGVDYDAEDWWFRTRLAIPAAADGEEYVLCLDGLATVADIYLDGGLVLHGESMFAAHELDLSELEPAPDHELSICCRALAPRLAVRRRPRARWRTKLVSHPNLRFFRTMLLGRAPGFAPGPAVVGPWRPVALELRRGVLADGVVLRARMRGAAGRLDCRGRLRAIGGGPLPPAVTVSVASVAASLTVEDSGAFSGTVEVPGVARWWPHTHGSPTRHDVTIAAGETVLHRSRVGFRTLEAASDLQADGLALRLNGQPVFARGAVWTPLSLTDPHGDPDRLRPVLERCVAAGLNMLRVAGIGCWESNAFHDLCDELGILVWQDFMFANLDYPESDPAFLETVEAEGREQLARVAGRPSLAVVCGGSEVAQQIAMLGLDPALAEGPLYGELLPRLVAEAAIDAPYVPSAPWGGALPFRPDRGVANYYGVGAYLRPLEDARRAEVRFAAECLAFANVPDDDALQALGPGGAVAVHHPSWKAGVARDIGAGWDFDDVRDYYLRLLFGEDPLALRYSDPERYLALSRQVSGEVMADTFGEWRRAASPCRGALVLWCKDLAPGAGWGLLDHRGLPKVALAHLRRALAPVAVWGSDEGLSGLVAHVANDRDSPLRARLRVALYRDGELAVEQAAIEVDVAAHTTAAHDVESVLGRFVDVTWAYRFGPPGHDLVALSLERRDELLSQAFRFPVGRPHAPQPAARLGLRAELSELGERSARLTVASDRFAYGVRVDVPGWTSSDDAFGVEPGHSRVLALTRADASPAPPAGAVSALNLAGTVRIAGGREPEHALDPTSSGP